MATLEPHKEHNVLRTDAEAFTAAQRAANEAACEHLVRGGTYAFDPPVRATAIPTGGLGVCPLAEAKFDQGWYIGFKEGVHVFQGRPIKDRRVIPTPQGYENAPNLDEILESLRASYFHVAIIGGQSVPTLINAGPQG